ncbi:MAG: hypothetical protein HKP54_07700 [Boseongicola sp.]|nr:hypothetical protein [Boseongicola sp.]
MTFIVSAYFIGALSVLIALSVMILKIGTVLGQCPDKGQAARAGSITIATGFAAIGAGCVTLIAAALPALGFGLMALCICLGGATLALGLGFSNAVATLRSVMVDTKPQAPQANPV